MSFSIIALCVSYGAACAPSSAPKGALCDVPGSHPTVQAAVNDTLCAVIDVLGSTAGNVTIERSLSLRGLGPGRPAIFGQVIVSGFGAGVSLENLHIDTSTSSLAGCFEQALYVTGDARVLTSNVRVSNADGSGSCSFEDEIFSDGFENN